MRWLVALVALGSCGGPPVVCTSSTQCGSTEACIDQVCREVACRSGADCPLETFCSLETYACEPGCATSDDCRVGDRCDVQLATCVPRQCTDTQLDCGFGERCDDETGRCRDDPEPHCEPCFSDQRCGPDGICATSTDGYSYCFLECVPEAFDPCPAGMQCSRTSEDLFRCVGYCGGL